MTAILVSAAHKSSGKTIVGMALCAALRARGWVVQPFKKGPDYIDPCWLSLASGKDCFNLDFNTMTHLQIQSYFNEWSRDSQLQIIEGNKGLYDGVSLDGSDCNAELGKQLGVPVILVFDAQGITRGVAPLLRGYQEFDPDVSISGVILNKVANLRHETKLRRVIEHYTEVPVFGAIPRDPRLNIDERHLGLIPSHESKNPRAVIADVAAIVEQNVDLSGITKRASLNPAVVDPHSATAENFIGDGEIVTLGVARDSAFGFYYPDDLHALRRCGVRLVFIDTLKDTGLPDLDGLFIGGGFPETHMDGLASNISLRNDIKGFIDQGSPVYAECGGLMYLSRAINWGAKRMEMVGALPLEVEMQERPVGRGYVVISETGRLPWGRIAPVQTNIPAHEFHYSRPVKMNGELKFAFKVHRGHGFDGQNDGLIYKNVVAGFTHLRSIFPNRWTQRFIEFIRQNKRANSRI